MKSLLISYMAILLLYCMPCLGQEHLSVSVHENLNHFQLEHRGDGLYRVVALDGEYTYPGGAGMPALPVRRISVLVPPGTVLKDFEYNVDPELVKEEVLLEESIPLSVLDGSKQDIRGGQIFRGRFPETVLSFQGLCVQQGYSWLSFEFSPFAYDTGSGKLFLNKRVEIILHLSAGRKAHQITSLDTEQLRHLKQKLLNPRDLQEFYPEGNMDKNYIKSAHERIDYLVITDESLKDEFKNLIDWKTRKGLHAGIMTVEEIDSRYPGPGIQLKIKQCLYDFFLHRGLKWALLGGDEHIVPVQYCYAKVNLGEEDIVDPLIPADLFYACFDMRFDWNSQVDDFVGQIYADAHDLIPDIYLSRVPVSSRQEVAAFVSKTLAYEQNPPLRDFGGRMMLSGVKQWNEWAGKSDIHHRSEYLYEKYISGNWDGKKLMFYDTGTDFPGGDSYDVTAHHLIDQLNSGYGFVCFTGHGNLRSLLMEKGKFDSEDALLLRHPVSGIILTSGCNVNAFDLTDPCLSEALLINPDGGCTVFFGSSRLGFGNLDETAALGPSVHYNARFAQYLFDKSSETDWKSLGSLTSRVKTEFAYNGTSGGTYHYLLYAINPIGDPEMPLYSRDPSVFDQVRIYRMGDSLMVHSGKSVACRICITSLDLGIGYQRTEEGTSHCTFAEPPGAFQVTITAPNHVPYIYRSSGFTGLDHFNTGQVCVYPNPSSGMVRIASGSPSAYIKLYDLGGSLILERALHGDPALLDLSNYPNGYYCITIRTARGNYWSKLLKYSESKQY